MTKEELQAKRAVALSKLKDIEVALCLDEHYIDIIEKENEELKEQIKQIEKVSDYNADQLTKAKEMLQTVFDKWKEERWILQSEKEVKQIENLMKQAEQFIKEIEK